MSVLGTKGTVKREYTKKLIADSGPGCDVTLVGAENSRALPKRRCAASGVSDDAIAAEIAPCFLNGQNNDGARTDTVVLACTHYPLLIDQMLALAPWGVDWIDPAPAIARRVSDLLGSANGLGETLGARILFTSGQAPSPVLAKALMPFFGASLVS